MRGQVHAQRVFVLLVGVLLLPLAINLASNSLPVAWKPFQWVAIPVAVVLTVILIIVEMHRRRIAADAMTVIDAADQLTVLVRRQWEAEAAVRRLNDPHPLPVSWTATEADLVEELPDLVMTANGWPGAPPPDRTDWATGPDDLAGMDNDLGRVLAQVPTHRLVVLGEPGAGKTMLLVRLVLDLIERRTSSGGPVPVLVSLASWNPAEQDLYRWLVIRLSVDYPWLRESAPTPAGNVSYAQALLDQGFLFLILDGLDEIVDTARSVAIARINDVLRPGEGLVLASRVEEYRHVVRPTIGPPTVLRGAAGVVLSALKPADVATYLRRDVTQLAAARWDTVVAAFGDTTPVAQALRTPLMVSLARTIYNPHPGEHMKSLPAPDELCDKDRFPTRIEIEKHLLDAFIPAAYRSHPDKSRHCHWSASQAERWFVSLAKHQARNCNNTTDLAWWEFRRAAPPLLIGLTIGSTVGILIWITVGTISGNMVGFLAGAMSGLVAGLFAGTEQRHIPARGLTWSSSEAKQPFSILVAAWTLLTVGNIVAQEFGLGAGIITGFASGILSLAMVGITSSPADARAANGPIPSLRRDRRTFWMIAAVAGIAGGVGIGFGSEVVFPLPFMGWPERIITIGIGCATCGGFQKSAWGSFFVARCWLALQHRLPWRLMSFLADSHEKRGVLRQAGAVYQFRHAELQQRLANRQPGAPDGLIYRSSS